MDARDARSVPRSKEVPPDCGQVTTMPLLKVDGSGPTLISFFEFSSRAKYGSPGACTEFCPLFSSIDSNVDKQGENLTLGWDYFLECRITR